MPYPVSVGVKPLLEKRNRLTTAFRLILAIPHLLLVGGLDFAITAGGEDGRASLGGEIGLLGLIAGVLAVVSWITIIIAGSHNSAIRQYTQFYLRWRVRALAYLMLFEDAYPPFGDGPYPAAIVVSEPIAPRRRMTVLLRVFLVIPHLIVLALMLFAWTLTTIAAWFIILFSGTYPLGLYEFGVGVLRWRLRVEAYMLLMVDEYPPFSLT